MNTYDWSPAHKNAGWVFKLLAGNIDEWNKNMSKFNPIPKNLWYSVRIFLFQNFRIAYQKKETWIMKPLIKEYAVDIWFTTYQVTQNCLNCQLSGWTYSWIWTKIWYKSVTSLLSALNFWHFVKISVETMNWTMENQSKRSLKLVSDWTIYK